MPATPPSPVIAVNGLGKAYRSYARQRHRLFEWLTFDRYQRHDLHWAIRDVTFDVMPGESVAIIGENGAGKSTLLKLITGVIRPTAGQVTVNGRVTALLELGLGFHGDFSGLENLSLSGQLQGMTPRDIEERTDWILDFADIGSAIHEPVRTYSSGMQMRLAFALAVAKRPDVLIVDEALSVGDIFFQQKCFDLLADYVQQGCSLLFVTHGMATAYHLCQRAVYLDHGQVRFDGPVNQAIDLYESSHLLGKTHQDDQASLLAGNGSLVTESIEMVRVDWFGQAESLSQTEPFQSGQTASPVLSVVSGDMICLKVVFRARVELEAPHVGFKLRNRRGLVVYETNTYCQRLGSRRCAAGELISVDFVFRCDVVEGDYNVTLGVATNAHGLGSFDRQLWYAHGLAPLTVRRQPDGPLWDGVTNLRPDIRFNLAGHPETGH